MKVIFIFTGWKDRKIKGLNKTFNFLRRMELIHNNYLTLVSNLKNYKQMKTPNYLLPNKIRSVGYILVFPGILLLILRYQFNYKPDFLNLKMFAFYTYYIQSKVFTVVKNQMIEELAAMIILAGMFIIAFTKEKTESEDYDAIRYRAFFVSAYLNLAFLILSLLFFFGFGFVGALNAFMGVWLLSYLLVFRYSLNRYNNNQTHLG